MSSVAEKTVQTTFWGGIDKLVSSGVQFIVAIVLARLLTPSDYGIIALLTFFIVLSEQIARSGFMNALIRKNECSSLDYSTAFVFNLIVSIALYLLLFLCSPLIAKFYAMPILIPVIKIYGIKIIVDSLQLVPYAILSRRLDFKFLAINTSATSIISGIFGILIAYLGGGVWALVVQSISQSLLFLLLIFLFSKWRISVAFSKDSFSYLWNFGSKMLLTGIIGSIYNNLYTLVIGKVYDNNTLGLFSRGQNLSNYYPNLVEGVFTKNSLPIMSQIQNDNDRLKNVYRQFVRLVCFVTFPVCIYMFVMARPLVSLLLGEKWIDCVIYVQIFALSSLLVPANYINLNIMQVKGRSDLTLRAEILKKSIGAFFVFIMMPYGAILLAIVSSFMGFLSYGVNFYYAKKVIDISVRDQILDLIPCMISSVIPGALIGILLITDLSPLMMIVFGSLLLFSVYYVVTKYIYKFDIYDRVFNMIKGRMSN